MERVVLRSKVDTDGLLRVVVPIGVDKADREMQVTIEPVDVPPTRQDEWREFIRSTAGSITDLTFVRQPQADFTRRTALPWRGSSSPGG